MSSDDRRQLYIPRNVMAFVRERDAMRPLDLEALLAPDQRAETCKYLRALHRDVTVQFFAHEARLADFRAQAALASMRYERLAVQIDDRDEESVEDLPPAIALDLFTARELRWKVRTTRFLHLIEDAQEAAGTNEDQVGILLGAIDHHQQELENDAEELDKDLYKVADKVRSAQ